MCRHHSFHHYCLRSNLRNWAVTYFIAFLLNALSREYPIIDDYTVVWGAGAAWGFLFMWAIEMAREWIKTWIQHD